MIIVRLSDLQHKDVINIIDGSKVGNIIDIKIDSAGNMEGLIVEKSKFIVSMFSTKNELEIKWEQIEKIGEDVILVNVKIWCYNINGDEVMKKIKINMLSMADSVDGQGVGSAYLEQVELVRSSDKFEIVVNDNNAILIHKPATGVNTKVLSYKSVINV